MSAADRLRALVNMLPPDAAVMLTASTLREWLDAEGDPIENSHLSADPTAGEVAEALGRSMSTIRAKCAGGEIPGAYKLNGREWRIPREAFRAYLEAQRSGSTQRSEAAPRRSLDLWRRVGRGNNA